MSEPITDEDEAWLVQRLVTLAKMRADAEAARARVIDCENEIGDRMGRYKIQVGNKTVKRHRRQPRARNWDSGSLMRVVLDSRVVDKGTGEVADETPVDKLLAVYGSANRETGERYLSGSNAKLRALEARGIQVDEFCEIDEVPGWSLEIR